MIRILILLILIFINASPSFSQKREELSIDGLKSYFLNKYYMTEYVTQKNYDSALFFFKKIKNSSYVSAEDFVYGTLIFYRKNNMSRANNYLKCAVKLNYSVEDTIYLRNWIRSYPLLSKKITNGLFRNAFKFQHPDTLLRNELIFRTLQDQMYRQNIHENTDSTRLIMRAIDLDNQKWLDSIINVDGWPKKSMVGSEGANGAWVIVQHADNDTSFQLKCLVQMLVAYKSSEVNKADLAYLIDRYYINTSNIQVFGSQFIIDRTDSVSIRLKPVLDMEHLDKLRSVVLLPPVDEYLKYAIDKLK
jgi:hypothetical protein